MTLHVVLLLVIVAAALVVFIGGWISVDLVGLLVLSALALTGLITTEEALGGFSSPAVVTVWAMFILSAGLTRTGVAHQIGKPLQRFAKSNEALLVAAIMTAASILSALINTVTVAAILLPAIMELARRSGRSPSRLLLPLALGCLLGGPFTGISTPPNILVTDMARDAGLEPFAIFDFTPITGAIVLAGILFMVLFGRMLLPVRSSGSLAAGASAGTPYEMEAHLFTTTIPIHSPLIGCTLAESRLGSALYLSVVAIQRNGQMILSPGPAERLQVHDTLIVHGQPEHLRRFHGSHHLQVASMEELGDRVDQCLQMIEGQVHKGSSLEGKTLAEIGLRREYQVHVLTLVAENQNRITDVRGHRLEAGDRLVLQGSGPVLNQISELGLLERIKSVSPDDAAALAGEGKHLMCVGVPEGSVLADRDLVEGRMGHAFGLTVVGILRGEEWVCVPSPHEKIVAGDLLLLQGSVKDLEVLEGLQDLEVNAQSKGLMAELESQQIGITEVLLSPRTTLVGRTLSDLRFREHYGVSVLALWRKGRPRRTGLQDMPLKFGDALLVYGQRQSLEAVAKDPDFLVLDQSATQAPALQKAPIAIFIMLSVLVSAISGLVPISIAAVTGASLMVLAGCLSIEAAYRAIDWRVVFLTASMLPLGMAVQKTGVAQIAAQSLIAMVGDMGPRWIVAALFIVTVLGTQVIPTAALVVLMVPVALNTASTLGISPHLLMMTIAISASASFASPVSHPAHLLVMGPGGYQFMDYVKVGVPVTIIALLVSVWLLPVFWPA